MKKEKHKYKNLKIMSLYFDKEHYQHCYEHDKMCSREQIEPIFNKPNIYLLNDKCWCEVEISGNFMAFTENKSQFLFELNEEDVFRIPAKDIELLKQLYVQNKKLLTPDQINTILKIQHLKEMTNNIRQMYIGYFKSIKNKACENEKYVLSYHNISLEKAK